MTGVIKNLKTEKGFGFVTGDNGIEYFIHYSSMPKGEFDKLSPGDKIEFNPKATDRGPRCEDVRVL